MKNYSGIFTFLIFYLVLILISLSGHFYYYSNSPLGDPLPNALLSSISLTTFTHLETNLELASLPIHYFVFTLLITQVTGILFGTYLLWLCWQFFDPKPISFRSSAKLATITILVCEVFLFAFFLYGLPAQLVGDQVSKKIILAFMLSVNSFHQAGLPFLEYFIPFEGLENSFMIQIGLIGGTILGGLGIYVLIDLFSPLRLRQRLANPDIDWSLITKIAVFGTSVVFLICTPLFLASSAREVSDKNLLESISISMLQVANARGLGIDLPESPSTSPGLLHHLLALMASGSFTTGGGIGLIFFFSIVIWPLASTKAKQNWQFIVRIVKIWLIMTFIFLSILYAINLLTNSGISLSNFIYLYSNHHLDNTRRLSGIMLILEMIAIFGGRMSFIIACLMVLKTQKNVPGSL